MSGRLGGSVVFVTGANGFIGRALMQRCAELGAEVRGLDFAADPSRNVIAGDLTRPEDWTGALQGVTLIIHAAAIVSTTASSEAAWRVNTLGTAGLLEHACRAKVSRFVHLSSVAVYGFDFAVEACETDPLRSNGNTYVDSKIAAEHQVLVRHNLGDIDCTIIRPADVYGPGSRPWVLLPIEMLRKRRFLLPEHGQGQFSPVYIDDLVDGIVAAATTEAASGRLFNIGGGITPTCLDFFSYHSRMANVPPPIVLSTPVALWLARAGGMLERALGQESELGSGVIGMLSRRAGYSIELANQHLGYEPRIGLEEGMARTAEWLEGEGLL